MCRSVSHTLRFLDLHIYNIKPNDTEQDYTLETTLAYKENSVFNYTPASSNIHPKYKCSVVPISLHRAHTRCTSPKDINHHIQFMKTLVKARKQDDAIVRKKYESFFSKRRNGSNPVRNIQEPSRTTSVILTMLLVT